jgi:anti-sigma regulatory factor (Ser/Thr protein kinase)/anti-anti-sigma regulatory factor
MIWKINGGDERVVLLPRTFNSETMYGFIKKAVDEQCNALSSKITFDFSDLAFIEPVGVVVLSNLIEYFKKLGVKTYFSGHKHVTEPINYLDDSGFFKQYLGHSLKTSPALRPTTMPLGLVPNDRSVGFVHMSLTPWVANHLSVSEESLATVRVCIEEVFHNIQDHSGVLNCCVFAQYFPKQSQLQIAISDFGLGIPFNVRKVLPDLSDHDALRMACQEGFTTKSNVNNRGVGLTTLMRYVTQRNGGTVLLASGKAQLSAVPDQVTTKITPRSREVSYPGTLVRVILRTDQLARMAKDLEKEDFSW